MHTVRTAPMLIGGNEVHTTRYQHSLTTSCKTSRQTPSARCAGSRPPPPPPRPPKPLALHPMRAVVPVVDDFNHVESGSEGPQEVRSDSSLEVLDEEEELGRSTQGWDRFPCFVCYCASGWAKFRPGARLS